MKFLARMRLRRSRRSQRWALLVCVLSLVAGALAAHGAYRRLMNYPNRPGDGDEAHIEFEIERGASFPEVLRRLVEHAVVPESEAMYFKLFVLHKGAASKVTAGPHRFRGDMTPSEVLDELIRPQPARETAVTIPEGKNLIEVAIILAEAGLGTPSELEAAMRDRELLTELGIPGETVEGYLFPDTYKLPQRASPSDLVRRLVARHHEVFADLKRRHRDAAEQLERRLEWGDHQLVILASVVEKETAAKHERPLIAGVFLNRMKFASFHPKLLQTDPTIVYGCTVPKHKSDACKQFQGRIRSIHLRDLDNPYNTYTHEGLPPGPISNPGRAALEAVFAPKASRFLYFVSRNDKSHQFSRTVAEHESAVELYQRQGAVGDGSVEMAQPP